MSNVYISYPKCSKHSLEISKLTQTRALEEHFILPQVCSLPILGKKWTLGACLWMDFLIQKEFFFILPTVA